MIVAIAERLMKKANDAPPPRAGGQEGGRF
jgi:hypothetical protein